MRDPGRLGASAFARLGEVDRLVVQLNLKDTPANRGLVLGMILQDLIISGSASTGVESPAWAVLAKTYLDLQPDKAISRELSVSERTVRRLREQGHRVLAASLLRFILRTSSEAAHDAGQRSADD